jgi:hypothetical protein
MSVANLPELVQLFCDFNSLGNLVENPVKLTPCFRSKLTPGKMGSCKSDFRSNVTP